MRKGTKLVAASAGLAMSLSMAACGDDGGSGSATGDRLEGVSLTVGSKDFTENIPVSYTHLTLPTICSV